jgi:serine/threonine protein kinase
MTDSDPSGFSETQGATVLRTGTMLRTPRTSGDGAASLNIEAGITVKQRYVLEEIIGSGAMGQVWRSKDLVRERARNARLHVAIKLLNADCAQHPDALVGLEREASKAQELAHPNIITVYNFDVDDDLGRAFISMECLEGESLEQMIRGARGFGLERQTALPIIEGMTEGLEYAHKKRVVHCDLKPGNVFVTSEGVPKILDFGIARAARLESAVGVNDQDGFKGFTPAYASLELIREQDPQTSDDVYSLGVVVYELLSGRHPFNGLPADVAKARALEPVVIKGLKAREWQAIARALSFERADRWASAAEFRKAFKGRTVLPRVLGSTVGVLAIAVSVFGYQRWRAAQPDVPFDQLPHDQQVSFLREIQDGDRSWQLVTAGQTFLINDALAHYGTAFDIHPKDSKAVSGLERSADYVISRLEQPADPQAAATELEDLQKRSAYLETYEPLSRAIERLKSKH